MTWLFVPISRSVVCLQNGCRGNNSPFVYQGASSVVPFEDASLEAKMLLHLTISLDFEGRYLLMSCISNHLRYPNLHTHYFSCILLWMFQEADENTAIQEQITR